MFLCHCIKSNHVNLLCPTWLLNQAFDQSEKYKEKSSNKVRMKLITSYHCLEIIQVQQIYTFKSLKNYEN